MRFNLDTSAIIALVSNHTHCIIRNTKASQMAINGGNHTPLLEYLTEKGLYPFYEHEFVVAESVKRETDNIMKHSHDLEKWRYSDLHIEIVPDVINPSIPLSRTIGIVDRIFISTGESYGLKGITADRKLISSLHHNGFNPDVIVILPRPLTR